MALSSARPWRPRPRDYDGKIITASSEFISCSSVTAITAEHQQLSGWWLHCCDQVRSWWWFVIITLVFISCYGPYFHSWGLPRESLHYVPNGSLRRIFFIFPKHWRHQAVSAPGGSGASPGQEEPAAEEMGNVTAKNFKHRGFSLKLRSGETSVVMFNI